MATQKQQEREKILHETLIHAVFLGHVRAVEDAGKCLNEHFKKFTKVTPTTPAKLKTAGPQVLDFILDDKIKLKRV